ncbi:MAG: hypothetical protein LBJ93_00165 [Clostridiales bacterium]|jgi:hypothetical protein|nr:hypothetical protein [Clostridiales bacterium]
MNTTAYLYYDIEIIKKFLSDHQNNINIFIKNYCVEERVKNLSTKLNLFLSYSGDDTEYKSRLEDLFCSLKIDTYDRNVLVELLLQVRNVILCFDFINNFRCKFFNGNNNLRKLQEIFTSGFSILASFNRFLSNKKSVDTLQILQKLEIDDDNCKTDILKLTSINFKLLIISSNEAFIKLLDSVKQNLQIDDIIAIQHFFYILIPFKDLQDTNLEFQPLDEIDLLSRKNKYQSIRPILYGIIAATSIFAISSISIMTSLALMKIISISSVIFMGLSVSAIIFTIISICTLTNIIKKIAKEKESKRYIELVTKT